MIEISMQQFLTVTIGSRQIRITPPCFEVDGSFIKEETFSVTEVQFSRKLKNGGEEWLISGVYSGCSGLSVSIELQTFGELSPFVRYRFTLHGNHTLTKIQGKDNLIFCELEDVPKTAAIYEISLSTFEHLLHCYVPQIERQEQADVLQQSSFMGPIAMIEEQEYCYCMAYEHGSEYGNRFIEAEVDNRAQRAIHFKAVKGTYCNGEPTEKYTSPWLHFGFVQGGQAELLQAYRQFLLNYITENTESRKPYIFYNTWNNQERNRAYRAKPYLDNMNLSNMLAEIDVAHKMGIDVFVLDTGWFVAPGDWEVNLERFPDGLKEVKARLDSYGMKLGLWFNPTAAAIDSECYAKNRAYTAEYNGVPQDLGVVWESKHCHGLCLASDYTEYYIEKLIKLHKELGVTYFKWDGIGMEGCNSPNHNHGTAENSAQERADNFSYKMGLSLCHIANEVCKACPDAIFDFDATEGGRFVGLGFLAVGKFFLINNGPYYMNFDIPNAQERFNENVNVFFHPGTARPRICRSYTAFDKLVPSNLFLVHFLPDPPLYAQQASIGSLVLGGNGIWGDLLSLTEEDIQVFAEAFKQYKRVKDCVVQAYPVTKGFVGANPEIHEKIASEMGGGLVCFFNKNGGEYTYLTQPFAVENIGEVIGADEYRIVDGRLLLTVKLEEKGTRVVYIVPKGY